MRILAKNLLLIVALAALLAGFTWSFPAIEKGTDFPAAYAAARMVDDGLGHQLYQPDMQRQYQARYSGAVGGYYVHPPFETLLYLPFARLPMQRAHALWSLLNITLLIFTVRLLHSHAFSRFDWRVLLISFFVFPPVLLNFLQGQDSVLLLWLEVLAFVALKRERDITAGCFLGCGLFRFHLVIPLAALLALKRPRLLAGFLAVGGCLVLVSVGISGWSSLVDYPRFLVHWQDFGRETNHPTAMGNLHGLSVMLTHFSATGRVAVLVAGSILVLGLAIQGWMYAAKGNGKRDLALTNGVTASLLLGYQLSPHDLTILLLPMLSVLSYLHTTRETPKWLRAALLTTLAVLFLPPLHLWLLHEHMYLLTAVPVLALFVLTYVEIMRKDTVPVPTA